MFSQTLRNILQWKKDVGHIVQALIYQSSSHILMINLVFHPYQIFCCQSWSVIFNMWFEDWQSPSGPLNKTFFEFLNYTPQTGLVLLKQIYTLAFHEKWYRYVMQLFFCLGAQLRWYLSYRIVNIICHCVKTTAITMGMHVVLSLWSRGCLEWTKQETMSLKK